MWTGLHALDPTVIERRGLQPLVTRDLIMLSDWLADNHRGDEQRAPRGHRAEPKRKQKLPWIWTVGSVALSDEEEDDGVVKAAMRSWNNEGAHVSSHNPLFGY